MIGKPDLESYAVEEDVWVGVFRQASDWSPLENDWELPGKLSNTLPGRNGDANRPVSTTNNTKPIRPAWPV